MNKVNTKVTLTLALESISILNEAQKDRVRTKLSGRLNNDDELVMQISDERSQNLNREIAGERMAEWILQALVVPKKRKKTKPTRASQLRRLDSKKKKSRVKKNRGRISPHD